jgi:hypothetical protein
MRATVLLTALLIFLVPAAFCEDVYFSTLVPKTAKSMAMGGVFSAVPTSEFSFFGNPAFFALNTPSFALPTLDVWGYGRPSSGLDKLGEMAGTVGGARFFPRAFEIMSEDGSSGGGASMGMGMAGKGMGFGFFLTTDNSIEGDGPDKSVSSDTEADLVLGLGFPIQLGSALLSIGGDIRPFYRIGLRDDAGNDPSLADLVENGTKNLYADAFFGAALDLGACLKLGALSIGLSVRDLAPAYPVSSEKLSKLQAALGSGNLPDTGTSLEARLVPLISAGFSWAPEIAPGKVEPALYLEFRDFVRVFGAWDGPESALDLVHAGAEIRFFRLLSLRGGYNRGCLSAGAGLKLLFLDLNAAVFSERFGALPGDDSRSGLALQAAIRF